MTLAVGAMTEGLRIAGVGCAASCRSCHLPPCSAVDADCCHPPRLHHCSPNIYPSNPPHTCRQREYQAAASRAATAAPPRMLRKGDVSGLLRALRADYRLNYFVTGRLSNDAIYDEQAVFADPTVSFRGEARTAVGWVAGRQSAGWQVAGCQQSTVNHLPPTQR